MTTPQQSESERFKGPAKYAEYLLARGLVSVLQRLPIGLAYRLGQGTGWLAWKLLKRRRATVRKNLEIVNRWIREDPEERGAVSMEQRAKIGESGNGRGPTSAIIYSPSGIEGQVREVFLRAGANLFAGFTFARMSPEQAERHLQVEGLEHLKSALAEGRGVIILLAHMGPWEALAQLPGMAQKRGIVASFGALYRPLNNAYLDSWYRTQREHRGTRLFSRRDGFHRPVDFLREGGLLGILSDQKMREGATAPYFAVNVSTSPIPGLFHRRSGAPLVGVSIATDGTARWTIRLHPVELPEHSRQADREQLAGICNNALETMLGVSPLDGFWFQRRF